MRSYNRENWVLAPHNRVSYQEIQSLFPTARMRSGPGPISPLPMRLRDLSQYKFDTPTQRNYSIGEFLQNEFVDAFLVLKNGEILTETYLNGMRKDSLHLVNSISKSFLGMLAGIIIEEGLLDPNAHVSEYISEFGSNAFAKARVSHILDMTAGVVFSEDYTNSTDDFWQESAVVGWRPSLENSQTPGSLFDYAQSRTDTYQSDGSDFQYRTLLTNVLGMLVERAAQQPLQSLMEERLIARLGFEQSCNVVVDPTGFPYFGVGMSLCARDLARFGLMIGANGKVANDQVVPEGWINQIQEGDDQLRSSFVKSNFGPGFPGAHYKNQCFANKQQNQIFGLGVYGQVIFVDRSTNFVGVIMSSHPHPADPGFYGNAFSALYSLSNTL